jgi:GNAT superfamily N-acetyltransferase
LEDQKFVTNIDQKLIGEMMGNSFTFKNNHFQVRLLNQPEDESILNEFCIRNSDFFEFQSGQGCHLQAANEILIDLPPGKQLVDKRVWGIFKNNQLLAVIESITDYPEKGFWFLGLFIIDEDFKKTGFSYHSYHYFEETLVPVGVNKIRLGVLAGNQTALRFWSKIGFTEIDRKQKTFNTETHWVLLMEKAL